MPKNGKPYTKTSPKNPPRKLGPKPNLPKPPLPRVKSPIKKRGKK